MAVYSAVILIRSNLSSKYNLENHTTKFLPMDSATFSASGDGSASVYTDVPFPIDCNELLEQAKVAVELAVKDNKQLMEIEFPTSGFGSVPGDGEGGIEMTESMLLIRQLLTASLVLRKPHVQGL